MLTRFAPVLLLAPLGACCCPESRPDGSTPERLSRPQEVECRRLPTRTDCDPVPVGGGTRMLVPLASGQTASVGWRRGVDSVYLEVESDAWVLISADGESSQELPEGTYVVDVEFDLERIRLSRADGLVIQESVAVWSREGETLGLWAALFDDAGLLEIARGERGASLMVALRAQEDGAP